MRNRLILSLTFATLGATMATGVGNGPDYVKWTVAKQLAAETGRPICVFTLVGEKGG